MTLRRPAALAALLLILSLAVAQEAPAAPTTSAPQITTQSPATTAPAVSGETPTPGLSDTSAPATATDDGAGPTNETTPAADSSPALNDTPAATPVPRPEAALSQQEMLAETASDAAAQAVKFLRDGGPSIWAIAALSVITLALILWKIWRLALIGAWSRGKAGRAVAAFERGEQDTARDIVRGRRGIRSKVVASALASVCTLPEDRAREETARVAKLHLASAGTGLGALELIATIAPLLGLLGTVLGMIAAFQALQAAGSKADPALLAGGIWEALLTTAAGMAVAIPASAALTWFEAVITRIRRDVEDSATRIFVAHQPQSLKLAAE
ncbi:MotA/TolQ/ExbB proton channel family protein [Phaeobacter porticola]|uniref:Putative integral membrane protein n=1 Tax=Phaeobacter porticola TaxID=1844006 RepID=A0A1L3I0J0_9RHOB|nr:MotA/TolQ/ExbB proton channel family protein [Phaeobacter porticola]APG45621.1 putative integral membrane protein [Phaeobacter porticola]